MIMDSSADLSFSQLTRRNAYVAWGCNVPEESETKIKQDTM